MTEIYILLAEEVAPSIINRPIVGEGTRVPPSLNDCLQPALASGGGEAAAVAALAERGAAINDRGYRRRLAVHFIE